MSYSPWDGKELDTTEQLTQSLLQLRELQVPVSGEASLSEAPRDLLQC